MAFTHLPLRRSFVMGIFGYLAGYALTSVVTLSIVRSILKIKVPGKHADPAPLGQILAQTPSNWVVSGWLFYNAHFVPTSLPSSDAPNGLRYLTNQNLLNEVGGVYLGLYLIPPLLLICAGYLVVRTGETPGTYGERNAGASVAVGYFPLFLAGAFLFTAKATNAPVSASPDGLLTVFLGLLYPVIFGAIGGVIAQNRIGDSKNSSS